MAADPVTAGGLRIGAKAERFTESAIREMNRLASLPRADRTA